MGNKGFRVKVKEILGSPTDALCRSLGKAGADMGTLAHRREQCWDCPS